MQAQPSSSSTMANNEDDVEQEPPRKGLLSRLPGGTPALLAFVLSLLSYTIQTESAQYVQATLGYRKPILSLYLGHSGLIILLPCHLLFLKLYYKRPIRHFYNLLVLNLHWQLQSPINRVHDGKIQEGIVNRLSVISRRSTQIDDTNTREWDQEQPRRSISRNSRSYRSSSSRGRTSLNFSRSNSYHGHMSTGTYSNRNSFQVDRDHSRNSIGSHTRLPVQEATPVYQGYFQKKYGVDVPKLSLLLLILMTAITIPALSWYCAVPMTSMADITALYNTFSMWALVFSVWFLGDSWNRFKICSVLMACGGVVVVAYGGQSHQRRGNAREDASNPLLGDFLALFGAVTMAAYEMAFKLLGTLPDEDEQAKRWENRTSSQGEEEEEERHGLLASEQEDHDARKQVHVGDGNGHLHTASLGDERTSIWTPPIDGQEGISSPIGNYGGTATYSADASAETPDADVLSRKIGQAQSNGRNGSTSMDGGDLKTASTDGPLPVSSETSSVLDPVDAEEIRRGGTRLSRPRSSTWTSQPRVKVPAVEQDWIPAPLPFGLHANAITAGIGLFTFLTLWIGVVISHFTGIEPFELPSNWITVLMIMVVILTGIIFNGCFMTLLGIWGPVTASVSCLLSTVAVVILDSVIKGQISIVSVVGCGFIICGFGILLFEPDQQH
ncbi:unnamed protein product [Sympodiomycopsis kandeliae]